MKKTIFIGPDIGIPIWPITTPTSNTAVTLPIEKFPILILPRRKPSPMVRKRASVGYSRNIAVIESSMVFSFKVNITAFPFTYTAWGKARTYVNAYASFFVQSHPS